MAKKNDNKRIKELEAEIKLLRERLGGKGAGSSNAPELFEFCRDVISASARPLEVDRIAQEVSERQKTRDILNEAITGAIEWVERNVDNLLLKPDNISYKMIIRKIRECKVPKEVDNIIFKLEPIAKRTIAQKAQLTELMASGQHETAARIADSILGFYKDLANHPGNANMPYYHRVLGIHEL